MPGTLKPRSPIVVLSLMIAIGAIVFAGVRLAQAQDPGGEVTVCVMKGWGLVRIPKNGDCLSLIESPQTIGGGSDGISGYEIVQETPNPIPANSLGEDTIVCPEGKVVLGGGVRPDGTLESNFRAISSSPSSDSSWRVSGINTASSATLPWQTYAICADAEAD